MSIPTQPLSSLCEDVVVGHVGPSSGHRQDDGVPFLMGKNVGAGFLKLDDLERVTPHFHRSQKKSQLHSGDVVVVRIGKSGQAAMVPETLGEANCSGLVVIKRPTRVIGSYLVHFLNSPEGRRRSLAETKGSTRQTLNTRSVAESEIPVPSFDEQRRIAEVLDRAEALRVKRRDALSQCETLNQAMFLELFGDPAANPKAWPRASLGDLIDSGPQNGLYKPGSDYGSGTRILRIDAFYDGEIVALARLRRVRMSDEERELYRLHLGDIVVNRVNSMEYLGKSALVPQLDEPTVFESNIMRFGVDRETVEPRYLVQFLQSRFIKKQILTAAKNAVNQASINQQDVKRFQINVPPLSLQEEFARRIGAVDKLKAAHGASLAEMDALFASLQHRAFRGEL